MIAAWVQGVENTALVSDAGWPVSIAFEYDRQAEVWKAAYGLKDGEIKPVPSCYRTPLAIQQALANLL